MAFLSTSQGFVCPRTSPTLSCSTRHVDVISDVFKMHKIINVMSTSFLLKDFFSATLGESRTQNNKQGLLPVATVPHPINQAINQSSKQNKQTNKQTQMFDGLPLGGDPTSL
jgi:hypothetical protein